MTEENELLTFSDVIGNLEALDGLSFLPTQEGMRNLKGLKEARNSMAVLSNIVLNNTSVFSTGFVKGRKYLFFYSDEGTFDYKRILSTKFSQLTYFKYSNVVLSVFCEKELYNLEKVGDHFKEIGAFDNVDLKILVVFDIDNDTSMNHAYRILYKYFKKMEMAIFIGDSYNHVEHIRR